MERMEAIIARINEQESRITLLEHRLSPTELRAAEPAPGSDAEHPPAGYVLVPHASGDRTRYDWLVWLNGVGPWTPFQKYIGETHTAHFFPCARPIPANEGDSRLTESVAIPVGSVPAGRVLKDGEVAVREAEWQAANQFITLQRKIDGGGDVDEDVEWHKGLIRAEKKLDALRAQATGEKDV